MNSKIKQKKGISLIVLVITIIIMIIIAAAIILSLNASGVIERAHKARTDTDFVNKKEAVVELLAEYDLLVNSNDISVRDKTSMEYVKERLIAQGIQMDWILTDSDESGDMSMGDLVTNSSYDTEQFYVIGVNGETVNLLAKNNLKSDGSVQDLTGASNKCSFSSGKYWSTTDINNLEIPSDVTSIVAVARKYGQLLHVKGRLMNIDELVSLGATPPYNISGCPDFIKSKAFWIGSAEANGSREYVWCVVRWKFNGL